MTAAPCSGCTTVSPFRNTRTPSGLARMGRADQSQGSTRRPCRRKSKPLVRGTIWRPSSNPASEAVRPRSAGRPTAGRAPEPAPGPAAAQLEGVPHVPDRAPDRGSRRPRAGGRARGDEHRRDPGRPGRGEPLRPSPGAGRTSPVSATSPTNAAARGRRRRRSRPTPARPPRPGRTPGRPPAAPPAEARTARPAPAETRRLVEHGGDQLEPPRVEPGDLAPGRPPASSATSAWTSTASARRPASGSAVAAPGSPRAGDQERRRGRPRAGRPPPISNQATSPSGPNRFLPPASIRRPERGSPSNDSTTSTACSSVRGPARSPSLVTCPVRSDRDPLGLGQPDERVRARPDLRRPAGHLRPAPGRGGSGSSRPRAGPAVPPGPRRATSGARARARTPMPLDRRRPSRRARAATCARDSSPEA